MWPDRVSNPGPLTYESGVLPTALRGPAGANVAQTLYQQQHPDDETFRNQEVNQVTFQ